MHMLETRLAQSQSIQKNSFVEPNAKYADLDQTVDALYQRAEELNGNNDRRGLFFLLYAPTVRRISQELKAGHFKQPEKVVLVAKELARRALASVDQVDEGTRSEKAWQSVARAAKSHESDLSVLCRGLNAHLTLDLPDAIRHAGADASFHDDLQHLGRSLVDETIRMQHAPVSGGEEKVARLFQALPAVPQLEKFFGQDTVRNAAYGTLLHEALTQGRLMTAIPGTSIFVDMAFHVRNRAIRHLLAGPEMH